MILSVQTDKPLQL